MSDKGRRFKIELDVTDYEVPDTSQEQNTKELESFMKETFGDTGVDMELHSVKATFVSDEVRNDDEEDDDEDGITNEDGITK